MQNGKIENFQIEQLDKIWHNIIQYGQKNSSEKMIGLKGFSILEITILHLIEHKPDIIIKEIKEGVSISGSTLTFALDCLRDRKFLKRVVSERDRRSYGLELTEKGKRTLEKHKQSERELFKKILLSLNSKPDRDQFLTSLKQIIEDMI